MGDVKGEERERERGGRGRERGRGRESGERERGREIGRGKEGEGKRERTKEGERKGEKQEERIVSRRQVWKLVIRLTVKVWSNLNRTESRQWLCWSC